MKKNSFAFHREDWDVKPLMVAAMMIIAASFVTAQESSAGTGFSLAGGKFGEINLKFGYQFEGAVRENTEWYDYDIHSFYPTDPGISFGAEYVYSLFNQTLKIGVGAQYELPRRAWAQDPEGGKENEGVKYSLLPIYATIQYHPIRSLQGLFIKGNVGYNILTSIELVPESLITPTSPVLDEKKGGLYWQVSAGFEADWGLLFECFYTQRYFGATWDMPGLDPASSKYLMNNIGVLLGYKIKL
jgi:hypothetical protein